MSARRRDAFLLPVRPHLRPKPRRSGLGRLEPASAVPVYEAVDRDTHPLRRGFDIVRFTSMDEARALPICGQA
jgi:hypothetical protein